LTADDPFWAFDVCYSSDGAVVARSLIDADESNFCKTLSKGADVIHPFVRVEIEKRCVNPTNRICWQPLSRPEVQTSHQFVSRVSIRVRVTFRNVVDH
jgi:hypothetical protein